MTQNVSCPGIGPPSAKAVLVSFIALSCANKFARAPLRTIERSRLLPMRRNRLVEVRQRFHTSLPRVQLPREQSFGIEVRQLDLATPHEGERRIEREVGCRQRSDQ